MQLRTRRSLAQTLLGLFAVLAVLNVCSAPVAAQTDELPEAQTILKKYVDALGGADALEGMRTLKTTGKIEFTGDIQTDFVAYFGKDRFYRKMDWPGDAVYEQGYNGEVAWEKNPSPQLGNRILDENERTDFIRRMDHLDMLAWGEGFDGEIETKAKDVSVRGVDCYEVEFAPTSGNRVSRYFAQDSGLLIKVATLLDSPNGALAVDIFYDDYKDFNDGKMSMKRTQEISGNQLVFVIEKAEVLDEFPKEFEAVPDDVQ